MSKPAQSSLVTHRAVNEEVTVCNTKLRTLIKTSCVRFHAEWLLPCLLCSQFICSGSSFKCSFMSEQQSSDSMGEMRCFVIDCYSKDNSVTLCKLSEVNFNLPYAHPGQVVIQHMGLSAVQTSSFLGFSSNNSDSSSNSRFCEGLWTWLLCDKFSVQSFYLIIFRQMFLAVNLSVAQHKKLL